jgi:intermembrane space import and assembly protein 40
VSAGNHSRISESPSPENSSKSLLHQQATSSSDPIPPPKNLSDSPKDKLDRTVPEQPTPMSSRSTESNFSDTQEVSLDQPDQIEELASEGEEGEADGEHDENGDAFNPVTGEINWDCPCLGGMAHGTCGPEFKEAFSCFVFSEDEPKGINCVEKFKAMQNCFREHPDEYADGKYLILCMVFRRAMNG